MRVVRKKMSCTAVKDIGDLYSRLFDAKPFVLSEISYFLKEFELKRKDREVENLFASLQNTSEIRDTGLSRCEALTQANLPELGALVADVQETCQQTLIAARLLRSESTGFDEQRLANRARRDKLWQRFVADVAHKQSRIDNTFEEKEEELRELYTDLACKLHMHI